MTKQYVEVERNSGIFMALMALVGIIAMGGFSWSYFIIGTYDASVFGSFWMGIFLCLFIRSLLMTETVRLEVKSE